MELGSTEGYGLIIGLGLVAAVLEGVGLSFLLPIVEIGQAEDPIAEADGLMAAFVTACQTLDSRSLSVHRCRRCCRDDCLVLNSAKLTPSFSIPMPPPARH